MAGGESRSSSDEGIRRRHSTQYHEDDEYTIDPATSSNSGPTNTSHTRSATEPAVPDPSQRSIQPPASLRSNSHGAAHHVRFSSDVERYPAHDDAQSGPSRLASSSHISDKNVQESTDRRPDLPELSIDTAPSQNILGEGTVQSPTGTRSPQSSTHGGETSPRWRDRGYSLRRTLFNRGMGQSKDGANSIVELQDVGPSTQNVRRDDVGSRGSDKKSAEPSITITPVQEQLTLSRVESKKNATQVMAALPNYEQWFREKYVSSSFRRKIKDKYHEARKFVLRIREIPPSKDGRHIDMDASRKASLIDERTGHPYVGNTIRSSRYTVYNFLPRQLFAQFSKLANFYFLCVAILQMIPGLSTTGQFTTIVPLMFFIALSIGKEGYDDWRRYKLDKEENNRDARVLHAYQPTGTDNPSQESIHSPRSGLKHWATSKWIDIRVGDIVKLERDEAAPADLVLLHSSGEKGAAYIETMALDGETSLKSKSALSLLSQSCDTVENLAETKAHFVVEDPNLNLYNFDGKVTKNGETLPLSNGEIIYRGSVMRNTREAVGLVIYTGDECKIRMNASRNPRIKAPSLQRFVNKIVGIIVVFVVALAIFNTVAYQIWHQEVEEASWYLASAGVSFMPILVSFIIMFNTMIPLSLYVSLEIIKTCQRFLLNDIDMYDEASNTPMEARTSTINEELGQVSYIFSDKTGTLTENSMKFRKLSVAGTAWLHDPDIKSESAARAKEQHLRHKKRRNKGKKPARRSPNPNFGEFPRPSGGSIFPRSSTLNQSFGPDDPRPSGWTSSARPAKIQPEMDSSEMLRYIQQKPNTVFARKARFFILSMALCHTCQPEKKEDGSIDFQASSPDELALVQAARELGFYVADRHSRTLTIKTFPNGPDSDPLMEEFEILDVIEFSSKRRRMSVVVKFPDGRICVICKGADSVMMQLLRLSSLAIQKTMEIEKRADQRKSEEAQKAIARRKSDQLVSPSSVSRGSHSFDMSRLPSIGSSAQGKNKLHSLRNQVGSWLSERQKDIDASGGETASVYYSPRPSALHGRSSQTGRPSQAWSEAHGSLQESDTSDLVDESLAIDDAAIIERCFQHINDFASEGLRTLLYSYRFLTDEEYTKWKEIYMEATTSLVDRQDKIERAGDLIEQDFELAGATAIEDKLQKGVPEAIDKLRRANIKMWMLTGDKRETAINIARSARLIKDWSTVTILDYESGEVSQTIASATLEITSGETAHSVVVVDGRTLAMIETDDSLSLLFFDLAIHVDSVICSRASPAQKAMLVKAIRHKVKRSVTLAIGDGANDIAMIQEAHVGIGITGKEGLQAARTSDYSIAQFRFLTKLLLVHGRWNYVRVAKYTVATFWKEMTFYLCQALYQRWAGYTGTSLYENWSISLYNTFFTSLPVIFLGVFEKDLSASTLLAVPELYIKGQRNGAFNFKIYLWWMFLAASESCLVYFFMYSLFAVGSPIHHEDYDIFPMGDLCYTAVVILVYMKLQLLEMHNISIANVISGLLCVGGWFLWNIAIASIYGDNTIYDVRDGFFNRFGQDIQWWSTLILTVVALAVIEIGFKAAKAGLRPTDTDIFQALEKDVVMRRRFEEASAEELQQGWHRGTKKSSMELAEEEAEAARQQAAREQEIADLLKRRGDGESVHSVREESGEDSNSPPNGSAAAPAGAEQAAGVRRTVKRTKSASEMLKAAFGSVKEV